MHKKIAIVFLLVSILLLNSCTFRGGKIILFDEDKVFNQMLEATKKQDKDALKAMFSKQASAKADNFDESMDCLFSLFQDGVESWERLGGPGETEGVNDDGTGRIWKEVQTLYTVKIDEQKYRVIIHEMVKDTKYSDNVGISSIFICKEGYNGKDLEKPGIVID